MNFIEKALQLDQNSIEEIEAILFEADIEDKYIQALKDTPDIQNINLLEKAQEVLLDEVSEFSKNSGMIELYEFINQSVFIDSKSGYKMCDRDDFVSLVDKYTNSLITAPQFVQFFIKKLS